MGPLGHSLAALSALAGAPLGIGVLALRPPWRTGLGERLGASPRADTGRLWVHGASVGEILAALPLADRLRAGGRRVLISTTTLTGREIVRRLRPELPSTLAPLDHPWCVARALARVRPEALLLVETELWPAWIAAASERRIPVLVVSGRISERSFPRYRRLRPLLRATFGRLAAVGARSDADAARFGELGVAKERISVTGDLKFELPEDGASLAPDLAAVLGDLPLVVAGSTHPGEEEAALEAFATAEAAGFAGGLVLAPRQPGRADEVAATARARGRTVRRRSVLGTQALATGEVLLLDTLGELAAVYTRARVALVGGTLAPVGGHNLLEPAHAGVPVLFGPYTANVREAANLLLSCGAGTRVPDRASLAPALVAALQDADGARRRGDAGRRAMAEHRGSVDRTLALVESVLSRKPAQV